MTTPRALVYVQHLLGVGHLMRAARVAEGLERAGIRTTVAEGGLPLPGFVPKVTERVALPPVKVTAEDMRRLLHPDGTPFTDADKMERCDALLALFRRVRPDILLIEAFPFGRRQMRFELLPLLAEAKTAGTPVVACSVRDILQERAKPERLAETVATLRASFDLVLVHGDGVSPPLGETFALAHEIADLIRYTGIVGPPVAPSPVAGQDLVISVGGGAVGYPLLAAAMAAVPLSPFRDRPVVAVAGPQMPEALFAALSALQASNIRLLRSVPDLPGLFAAAKLSVSQAGYNTVAEIMASGCRAVLCPFVGDGQTEQAIRATALASTGRCATIDEDDLTPARMAAAMDKALALPAPLPLVADGAARAAAALQDCFRERLQAR